MTKDFWEKVNRLEELAKKVNSGPWEYDGNGNIDSTDHEAFSYIAQNCAEENAEYIAAAHPAMIKEMIYMLKLQKKYLNFCDEALEKYNG